MENLSKLLMLVASLVIGHCLIWQTQAYEGTNSNVLRLNSSIGAVMTRLGCTEMLRCRGRGTNISWKKFGNRMQLQNSSSYYITEEAVPVAGSSGLFDFTSRLVFHKITTDVQSAKYTCFIEPSIYTIQMTLDVEAVYTTIEPPTENIDLSNYYVGDVLTVSCQVKTCSESVTVQFVKRDQLVAKGSLITNSDKETIYTMNMVVNDNSADTYACMVRTEIPNDLIIQTFKITGTPVPRHN